MIRLSGPPWKGGGLPRRARGGRPPTINREPLEPRTVLSALTVTFPAPGTASTLLIQGDQFNDNFVITENGDGTVTVAPGATFIARGQGLVAGSSINGIHSSVGFKTGNPVSSISLILPGTHNFDSVTLLGQGKTTPTTVRDVTVTATGGVNLNFAAKGVANLGNFILTNTSSAATDAALTAIVDDCSFATLAISQTGGLRASVELSNDNIPGPVSVSEGNGNGDSITLGNGNTFGPTTLTQGGGGPTGAAVGNSDAVSVNGGRYRSLTVNQLLDGTNNTITINNIVILPFNPVGSDGVTTTQGNGAGDV